MANVAPLGISVKPDDHRPGRFRWLVNDKYSNLFKSPGNFATQREALTDAEKFVDKLVERWQRRN